ncbi:DNA polymerase III subunit chi [Candidatus Fokinia solitaria]|uniref:DNA polymerase III subunit chi n=1 Tax=Candidatus Fokinia solitaria TaxID=1802984 RepID=A0A2U8BS91_9RICK|nr:DNA polymerase III subunit chi [Candidatus Fokinia solitaria]AWD33207.1 DNA polymerase III subunit chi [Candidatus Fokinia solitaria]
MEMTLFLAQNAVEQHSMTYNIIDGALSKYSRVLVSFTSREEELFYDGMLWSHKKISFIPHGMAHEELPTHQPVLLGDSFNNIHNNPELFIAMSRMRLKEYELLNTSIWRTLQRIALIVNIQDISLDLHNPIYKDNLLRKLHDSNAFDIDIESILHYITSINISLYKDLKWSKIPVI